MKVSFSAVRPYKVALSTTLSTSCSLSRSLAWPSLRLRTNSPSPSLSRKCTLFIGVCTPSTSSCSIGMGGNVSKFFCSQALSSTRPPVVSPAP
ncbi:hypothetical protein D9M73_297400 [compost metagenome]